MAVVAQYRGGLEVIDVSDPTVPQFVGRWGGSWQVTGVDLVGTTAIAACGADGLFIIDVTDPARPVTLGRCGTIGVASDAVVEGDFAYVADGNCGLAVVDISDPLRPVGIGSNPLFPSWKVSASGNLICSSGYDGGLAMLEPYDEWFQWRVDRLGPAPGGPFGPEAREGDDPDGDGLPNLMEFALSMDPLQRDGGMVTGGEPVIGDAGEPALRFTVRRNGVNDSVDYVVEISEDLVGWRFDPALLTTVRDDGDALVVDVAMGPDDPVARFARLRVVRR
ncbi:MAG: hypothetical protein IT577_15215 [Verrucomicrobiae bacterium]|nr:hypothetical protein [Verrucomicrobiae bacterium]